MAKRPFPMQPCRDVSGDKYDEHLREYEREVQKWIHQAENETVMVAVAVAGFFTVLLVCAAIVIFR